MEASLNIRELFSAWGVIIISFLISVIGFLGSRIKRNVNISWISSVSASIVILVFSVLGKAVEDPFQSVLFDNLFFVSALIISAFSVIAIFLSLAELEYKKFSSSEFFFFIYLSSLGAILMTSSGDFLTLFLSKELMSFPIYAMVYSFRDRIGVEAALKYFVAGAIFSLIYLVGFSFFLMSEGTLKVAEPKGILGLFGVYLIIFALLFKGGTAPFHFWVPDVYQGAPSSAITFAGPVVKFSSFIALLRVVDITKIEFSGPFQILAIISIIVGILGAIPQKEIKRLIAYSSISHSGFLIFFFFSIGNIEVKRYFVFYLATYGLATAGIFGVFSLFENKLVYLDKIIGFSTTHRFISFLLAVFLISFAGIPLTAGFFAKYLSFISALHTQKIIPVLFGAVGSIASIYFYFQPVSKAFMEGEAEKGERISINPFSVFLISVLALALVFFGVFPELFFRLIEGIPLSF